MPESRVRVLIVNPKLNQAVGIKNALEAVGGFEARPFTSPANALEFARVTPPDAAVLDIAIRSPNVGEVSVALRKLNPKLRLLLTNAPDEAVSKLRADGTIPLPARAREIEPLLRRLFPPPPALDNRPPTPVRRPVEMVNPITGGPPQTPPNDPSQPDPFARIAAEEPPIPTVAEGGTVREAVRALLPRTPLDESMYVVEITPRPSDTDEGQPVPAEPVLPPPAKADDDPFAGIAVAPPESPAEPPSVALPTEPVAAPDDTRPRPEVPAPVFDDADADLDEPPAVKTQPAAALPPPAPAKEPPAEQAVEPPPAASLEPAVSAEPAPPPPPGIKIPGQRRPVKKKPDAAAPPAGADLDVPAAATPQPPAALSPSDLRRALNLTYEQLGTAASVLILTQGQTMLAYSGEMPTEEIEELRSVIGSDWDVRGTQARIRYITLPTSRQEYMLHTRRTDDGFALSMAFAGDLPVREIRAQSDAVAATLEKLRAAEPEDDSADTQMTMARLPFTAVWMLADPDDPLTADVAQAVVLEFDSRLRALGWPIHAMNVHADFVYVFCDVQTTYLASEIVADLKRISAEAACSLRDSWQPDTIWADAYMALMPGRELGSDEVQSFLTFTRSRLHRKID